MRYRAILQAQRSRRNLSQQAMQRAPRRCDLIRLAPEEEPAAPPASPTDEERLADEMTPVSALS